MRQNPFAGDVLPLTGQPGSFRRRVGNWRIFFDLDRAQRLVEVRDIVRRATTTYRKR
jgi:mRNA-degrading endonuclease RelE of RelBE toxin-antitoxin system